MTQSVRVEKRGTGYALIDEHENGMIISGHDAQLLYDFIWTEHFLDLADVVRERAEMQDIELSEEEVTEICTRLKDEIMTDELFFELEDKNIDYLISELVNERQ